MVDSSPLAKTTGLLLRFCEIPALAKLQNQRQSREEKWKWSQGRGFFSPRGLLCAALAESFGFLHPTEEDSPARPVKFTRSCPGTFGRGCVGWGGCEWVRVRGGEQAVQHDGSLWTL